MVVAASCSRVVLPAPFGPSTTQRSSSSTVQSTASSSSFSPRRTVTCASCRIASGLRIGESLATTRAVQTPTLRTRTARGQCYVSVRCAHDGTGTDLRPTLARRRLGARPGRRCRPGRPALPARRGLGRRGNQLQPVVTERDQGRGVPVRRPGTEHRVELAEQSFHIWHGYLPGINPGQRYGYRIDRPGRPAPGNRHNPRSCWSTPTPAPSRATSSTTGLLRRQQTSTPPAFVPRSVVVLDDGFPWGNDRPPQTAWDDTIIYELHVKGFTARHPDIPADLRGTYAGLAHPAAIAYLKSLGVTAVELLPIHALRARAGACRSGDQELLGLQLDRVLRPARRLRHPHRPARRQPGARVQGDGPGPARRRHRGHPRRRLQPHRRGTAGRADAVASAASTTAATTGSTRPTGRSTSTTPAAATPSTPAPRRCCSW